VDLFKDGRCLFIQTSFIFGYGERGRDGREHNYWVYSIVWVEMDRPHGGGGQDEGNGWMVKKRWLAASSPC